MSVLAVLLAAAAFLVLVPPPTRLARPVHDAGRSSVVPLRATLAVAAGCGAWVVVGGSIGVVAGVVATVAAWRTLASAQKVVVRREGEAAARELPHLVELLAATLRAGAPPMEGLSIVCAALPGPASRRLAPVLAHAGLGGSPIEAWDLVADDPVLSPLGRALVRSHRTGAPVVDAVEQLADELEREAHALAEDRARRVGVLAAIPLGVCLLPAFLLLGIVPTVAVMLQGVTR